MGAICVDPAAGRATVDQEECVECYSCFNGMSQEHLNPLMVRSLRWLFKLLRLRFDAEPDVCPTAAFEPEELTWPRVVRRAFSDPRVPHESTGIEGRGTEEVKTNDVTGRVRVGEAGFTIDLGRPGVGVRFREIDVMTRALAKIGVVFERKNPLTSLMSDAACGAFREDILKEKVLSAIVEFTVPVERIEEVVHTIWDVEKELDNVIALAVGTRCEENGEENIVAPILERLGYRLERAKTNIGLGRSEEPAVERGRREDAQEVRL